MIFSKVIFIFKIFRRGKTNIDIKKIDQIIVNEYMEFSKERGKYSFCASEEGIIKAFFTYLKDNNIIKNENVNECKFIKTERKKGSLCFLQRKDGKVITAMVTILSKILGHSSILVTESAYLDLM